MQFIGRISGVVAYTDDSSDNFCAHLRDNGDIVITGNDIVSSDRALLELHSDTSWLTETLALLSSSISFNRSGSNSKTVRDAVIHITGRVARDDNTCEDFAVQYDSSGGVRVLVTSGSINVIEEFVGTTIKTWLEAITNSGTIIYPIIGGGESTLPEAPSGFAYIVDDNDGSFLVDDNDGSYLLIEV